eukprot:GILI01019467.1.p1 GENE.GILI01019467.1~~GILI01019467.1.p1  ORF type:complete len:237 (-),score=55.49 GILI01019467.1:164-874(-)
MSSRLASSPNSRAGQLPALVPPGRLLTGHMYVALDIDTTRKNVKPIDLSEAIPAFVQAVTGDPNNFYQGITMPPKLTMEGIADIPIWIFDPSKSKVLRQREEEAAAKALEAEAAAKAVEEDSAAAGKSESVPSVGQKRVREDEEDTSVRLPQRTPVTSLAALTGSMAQPQALATSSIRNIPSATPLSSASAANAPKHIIPIAQSVVLKGTAALPLAPLLTPLSTDVNVDDELGMDF